MKMRIRTSYFLDKFQASTAHFDRDLFTQKKLEYKVGVWLKSVALKFQKKSWINTSRTASSFEESIFFGIWLNDELIRAGKLNYSIHALKLRQLTGYSIKSRDFAEAFRSRFSVFETKWPNVSTNFGPLTLMQGWVSIDISNFENELVDLAHKFLEIQFIIDDLLEERKKSNTEAQIRKKIYLS